MKEILIATKNKGKVKEFKALLEQFGYDVKSLLDINEEIDIVEDGVSFEENAIIKARTISRLYNIDVIGDDSGLCIDHLDGLPGITSARWLGEDTSYDIKNQTVLDMLKDATKRSARYVCAVAIVRKDGTTNVFKGICEGEIAKEPTGTNGFGYDPIFYYPDYKTTLANVSDDEKNLISHRAIAINKLVRYLNDDYKQVNVVLYEPEIPGNTGNIMRTCMASDAILHLIEPLGFKLDEKSIKRAGMDYIHGLVYMIYKDWDDFIKRNPNGSYYFLSRYGNKKHSEFNYKLSNKNIYLVLGKESSGIDKQLLYDNYETTLRLPMSSESRSLNLSNTAAIIVYEVLRQLDYQDLATYEVIKGKDYIYECIKGK